MKLSESAMGRLLALSMAAVTLASCVAHGQQPSMAGLPPELRELPHWKVFRNHTPYSEAFYRNLMTNRIHLYAAQVGNFRNVVSGQIFASNGTVIECLLWRVDNKFFWNWQESKRWSLVQRRSGVRVKFHNADGSKGYGSAFYDPETGGFTFEYRKKDRWFRTHPGLIQDTWPRVLAEACPNLKLPAHIRINEKQTSRKLDELRRQDPDAPIRNFPGSQLTAPGRTGLARSGGKPTTTAAEVEAYLNAQEGNIVRWNGHGWVWVRSGDREEVWRVQGGPSYGERFFDVVRSDDGSRITIQFPTRDQVYMVGYPFPYLPTGHRHPAFQLTDKLIAHPYPRTLPFMGEAYADKRFVFHPEGKFSVVDEAGNLVEGPHFDGTWRWTRQALEMTVRDDPAGFQLIHWRSLAHQLGMKPTVWTPSTPDRY